MSTSTNTATTITPPPRTVVSKNGMLTDVQYRCWCVLSMGSRLTLALMFRWKIPSRFRNVEALIVPFPSTSKNSKAVLISFSCTRTPPLAFFGTCFTNTGMFYVWVSGQLFFSNRFYMYSPRQSVFGYWCHSPVYWLPSCCEQNSAIVRKMRAREISTFCVLQIYNATAIG